MFRKLYHSTLRLAGHRHALWWLAAVAFIESSVFPIPPDLLLIPMVLAVRERAWLFATVCTVASVLGGMAGYGIGYFLYDTVGRPLLDFYGYAAEFHQFTDLYNAWGWWIVFGAGLTPFPYKVITIASGVTGLDLFTFTVASIVGRGGRFFLVAALLWQFGPAMRTFIEERLGLLLGLTFAMLIAGFAAVKYVF